MEKLKGIDTVIFDLDGTLLHTLQDLCDSCNYALSEHGMPVRTYEEVRRFVGNGVAKLMERAIPGGISNPDFERTFADFKKHYLVHCNDQTKPYDGIMELLGELQHRGIKTAIVSNKYMDAVTELNRLYFGDYIKVAIGETTKIRKKPAPDTVLEAIRELGSAKEHCVYVGDSEVDIQTAANVGIPCITCTWGFRTVSELSEAGADIWVHKPWEIIDLLQD